MGSTSKFGMVVRVKAFHELVPAEEYNAWHLDAYSYAGRACVAYVRLWADQYHLRSLPEIVFASGDTGRDQLEIRLKRDGFDKVRFQPAIDQVDRKTGFIIPAAVPLQASDLFAYELFAPVRTKEQLEDPRGINRDYLDPAWFILDKISGEPRVTEDASLKATKERLDNFTGDMNLVKLAKWMPEPMSHV
jgi:hypothetical protein